MRCAEHATHTGQRSIQGVLVGKLEGKKPLGKHLCSREDNAKTYPVNMMRGGREGMDCIDLAQDRDKWQIPVNKVMNLQVP